MNTSNSPSPVGRSQRAKPRGWLPYAGAVVLLLLIVVGFWPQPAPAETARVASGPLRSGISEEGRTRLRQRYLVSAPVAGNLRRIEWKPGAVVQVGQSLGLIDPLRPALLDVRSRRLSEARRDSAQAKVDSARASHRFATNELRRIHSLHQERTVSAQELEQAEWREASSSRELAGAEAVLQEVLAELGEYDPVGGGGRDPVVIKSPAEGRVLRVYEESARAVAVGTPILEIGDPADLEVVVEALSRDAAMIQPGTPVELEQWGGAGALHARVRLVEPMGFTKVSALGVEEQRVLVVADLLTPVDKRGNLGDQFRVEARIITWQSEKVLKAPAGALFRQGDRWGAYVVRSGRAVRVWVQVGHTSGIETEVLSGLAEGDEVILYPGDRIREGLRVRPVVLK